MRSPGRIKRWVYRRGFRPSRRSLFYSPSLDFQWGWYDAFTKGKKKR